MTSPEPLSWNEVLDRVAQTLRDAEAEAMRAEQGLARECANPRAADMSDERLRGMLECLARAERAATDAETAARHAEEAFAEWLARLDAARQKLVSATDAAVS